MIEYKNKERRYDLDKNWCRWCLYRDLSDGNVNYLKCSLDGSLHRYWYDGCLENFKNIDSKK